METPNKEITLFCFGDQLVRVFDDENGNPWFVAKDVCRILDLGNVSKACNGLDEDEKGVTNCYTHGGIQEMLTVSESGLYALVFRSRKPEAKAFSKWVRSEVLPSIRKTGTYTSPKVAKISESNNSQYSLPVSVIEMSARIKPALRQRLWRDSLDTARLDGGGVEAACGYFISFCEMQTARASLESLAVLIGQFMDEKLEHIKGFNASASKIYDAFTMWWKEFMEGPIPSRKILGRYLQTRFHVYKSSVSMYKDCRIRV